MAVFRVVSRHSLAKLHLKVQSVHLEFNGEVVLDGGHYTRDELKEEEKTILYARLAAIALNLFNHFLHHCCVVARVNAKLLAGQLGVRLESHRFLGVVRHNVLVHLHLGQQVALLRIPLQP